MGQTLLANQFVAGLRPELKRKLIGVEGSLEELILKARFEEAKGHEFAVEKSRNAANQEQAVKHKSSPKKPTTTDANYQLTTTPKKDAPSTGGLRSIGGRCFNCGIEGHMSRACPYPRKSRQDEEAHGRKEGTMSALTSSKAEAEKRAAELREQLREVEMQISLEESSDVLHAMSASQAGPISRLGPSVFAEISVNGVPATALVDTGSPATIISLEFVMRVMLAERKERQSPEQWRADTLKRFTFPDVSLRNYGGHPLDILSQTLLRLTRGNCTVDTAVLVQKGAPNQLLLGTDVQSRLGFALTMETSEGVVDLLAEEGLDRRPSGRQKDAAGSGPGAVLSPEAQPPRNHGSPPAESSAGGDRVAKGPRGGPSAEETPFGCDKTSGAVGTGVEVHPTEQDSGTVMASTNRPPSWDKPMETEVCSTPEDQSLEEAPSCDRDLLGAALETTMGVVRLLKAEKIPAGYQKRVRTRTVGDMKATLLLFTPVLWSENVLLADAIVEGPCASREQGTGASSP